MTVAYEQQLLQTRNRGGVSDLWADWGVHRFGPSLRTASSFKKKSWGPVGSRHQRYWLMRMKAVDVKGWQMSPELSDVIAKAEEFLAWST